MGCGASKVVPVDKITVDTSLESLEKTAEHLRLTDADGEDLKAVEAMIEARKRMFADLRREHNKLT